MSIVIYHNPECGTSRTVLETLVNAGHAPIIIDYRDTGWTKPQLQGLFAAAGLTAHAALRTYKTKAEDLGLTDPNVPEDTILDAMVADPILVNRPIVCTNKGVRQCRPAETVLDILPDEVPKNG